MPLPLHKAQGVTDESRQTIQGEHSAWCHTSLLLLGLNPAGKLNTKFSLVMLAFLFCGGVRHKWSLKGIRNDHRKNSYHAVFCAERHVSSKVRTRFAVSWLQSKSRSKSDSFRVLAGTFKCQNTEFSAPSIGTEQ